MSIANPRHYFLRWRDGEVRCGLCGEKFRSTLMLGFCGWYLNELEQHRSKQHH